MSVGTYAAVSGYETYSYIRHSASSCRISPTDVHAWMISTVEQTKMSTIKSAQRDIDMLHEHKCFSSV